MAGRHTRNITGLRECRRCGARTRQGTPCRAPAVRNKERCRMHGGAKGSGAPKGNKNALVHGLYSRKSKGLAAFLRQLQQEAKETL